MTVDARKFFAEGFAEFVTSLTRKNSPEKKVTEGIAKLLERKRVGGELEYYVKEYLAFRIIAKSSSAEHAIKLGMTSNFSDLRKESRAQCQRYGIATYF